jgi:hypothetical protein
VPYCADERITVVTSFRPSSPFLQDDSRLTTVRAVSDTPRLYREFFEYRENIAIERLKEFAKVLSEWCPDRLLKFLDELIEFLQRTRGELWDIDVANPAPPPSPGSDAAQSVWKATDGPKSPIEGFLPAFIATAEVEAAQSRISRLECLKYDSKRPRNFIIGQVGYLEEMKRIIRG